MATTRTYSWKWIMIAGGIVLVLGLLFSGFIIPLAALLLLLLVMGGGALLYRKAGPPER